MADKIIRNSKLDTFLSKLATKLTAIFWRKGETIQVGIDDTPTANSSNLVTSGGVFDAVNGQYIMAWDGASSPVAANIPAGVSVVYNGVTTTGTLAASASTRGKIYLVSDGNGQYGRYYTSYDGSTYSWASMGSTAMDLSGYATEEEVIPLEQEVYGVEWRDAVTTITNSYYISAKNNANLGGAFYNSAYKRSDYIDLQNATKVRISVCTDTTPGEDKGCVFYNASQAAIPGSGVVFVSSVDSNDVHELAIPAGAKFIRTTMLKNVAGDFVCKLLIQGSSLKERITENENDIQELQGQLSMAETLDAKIMEEDITAPLAVDWMQFVHSTNGMTDTSVLEVVSATETAMTFSAGDAAKFAANSIVAVKFSDGAILPVYVKAAVGTTVERESFETTDLSNAVSVQSVHDTAAGGNGQHLTPYGYIALARFTREMLGVNRAVRYKNFLGGLVFSKAKLSPGYTSTPEHDNIYDEDDNLICTPVYHNFAPGGTSSYGVADDSANANGQYSQRRYIINQSTQGAYVEFPITGKGKGFLLIESGLDMATAGSVQVDIYADGSVVNSFTLTKWIRQYTITGLDVSQSLSVRFSVASSSATRAYINYIGFYKMYSSVPAASFNSFTKVAFIGDSWTQYPPSNKALADYAEYNETVIRPDGTTGDGYGYLPKAFATLTGATVHNWGKSDQRTDTWGLPELEKALDYTHYDYVFIEFFINDYNSPLMSFDSWKANIKAMCDKCRRAGATPVVLMPCGTNSHGQLLGLGAWNMSIVKGVYMDSGV